jgi:hypothetical protein
MDYLSRKKHHRNLAILDEVVLSQESYHCYLAKKKQGKKDHYWQKLFKTKQNK